MIRFKPRNVSGLRGLFGTQNPSSKTHFRKREKLSRKSQRVLALPNSAAGTPSLAGTNGRYFISDRSQPFLIFVGQLATKFNRRVWLRQLVVLDDA